ncbi:MAG: hypothetical protein JXB07_16455 [Anaerolineae bacterium]|nr:hypothetical protein [Anaerolineae bacterium]
MNEPETAKQAVRLTGFKAWNIELVFAVPIVAFVFYLFYTWYAVLDRYFIFLYFHDMGPGFDTTPFSPITSSRYWMSGLVAAGAVMVPYVIINFVLGRLVKAFRVPVWWRQWSLCAVPLLIALPALVMTVNDPVLPPINAAQVTVVALIGLALAVMPGKLAAEKPLTLVQLAVDGFSLAIMLLFLGRAGNIPEWLAYGKMMYVYLVLVVVAGGLGLIMVISMFYVWRRMQPPGMAAWLVAGLIIAYLLLPVFHHVFLCSDTFAWFDPGYFVYISNSSNFFADNTLVQIGVWGVIALLVLGITHLRQRLHRWRTKEQSE